MAGELPEPGPGIAAGRRERGRVRETVHGGDAARLPQGGEQAGLADRSSTLDHGDRRLGEGLLNDRFEEPWDVHEKIVQSMYKISAT